MSGEQQVLFHTITHMQFGRLDRSVLAFLWKQQAWFSLPVTVVAVEVSQQFYLKYNIREKYLEF